MSRSSNQTQTRKSANCIAYFQRDVKVEYEVFRGSSTSLIKSSRLFIIKWFYWLLNGTNWLVFWLVWIVYNDNPDLLEDIGEDGDISLGAVYIFDRVFHVLPSFISLLYLYIRYILQIKSLRSHYLFFLFGLVNVKILFID